MVKRPQQKFPLGCVISPQTNTDTYSCVCMCGNLYEIYLSGVSVSESGASPTRRRTSRASSSGRTAADPRCARTPMICSIAPETRHDTFHFLKVNDERHIFLKCAIQPSPDEPHAIPASLRAEGQKEGPACREGERGKGQVDGRRLTLDHTG